MLRLSVAAGEFQFHKGTIKTVFLCKNLVLIFLFQFHKGTIKTLGNVIGGLFGSKFQFHKGTIKTSISLIPLSFTRISIP